MRSAIPVGASCAGCSPLNFILRSAITVSTPLPHLELHIRYSSFPCSVSRFPTNSSYFLFKPHFDSLPAYHNSNLLDITDRAKQHWDSISPARQPEIIRKYKEHLHLLCAVDELCVPEFVGPDAMEDLEEDVEIMFDCMPIA
jgi:hypothetical protein